MRRIEVIKICPLLIGEALEILRMLHHGIPQVALVGRDYLQGSGEEDEWVLNLCRTSPECIMCRKQETSRSLVGMEVGSDRIVLRREEWVTGENEF